MKIFIVYYRELRKLGPEDWEMTTIMKEFTENTTLKEVRNWWKNKHPNTRRMFEINLQEIDQLKQSK